MTLYKMAGLAHLVVLTFFVIVVKGEYSSCTKTAMKYSGNNLMGGWKEHIVPDLSNEMYSKITVFTEQALKNWNRESNNLKLVRPVKADREGGSKILSVYTQMVAGMNYCVKFEAEPYRCKNGVSNDEVCTSGVLECEFRAYDPLEKTSVENIIQAVNCNEK